jgi:REP element-mobilizing transposase RayT
VYSVAQHLVVVTKERRRVLVRLNATARKSSRHYAARESAVKLEEMDKRTGHGRIDNPNR